ncbi:hypothetical protein ACFV2U_04405 [Streptomyces sp. NPDC059697]|uniref:hypothetical protein n=1 Tax=Streptomyces sp. NPDC059697 TaxID=3346912 RepID=UPI0036AC4FED
MPGPETASDPSSPAPATSPGLDTASEVVRWAAFSCVLVPVVLVGFGTSLAGAAGTALGLAAVTGACRVLLRQSERVAARLHADEPVPPRARHSRTGLHGGVPHHHHGRPRRGRRGRTGAPRGKKDPGARDDGVHGETAHAEGTTPGTRSDQGRAVQDRDAQGREARDRDARDREARNPDGRNPGARNPGARAQDTANPTGQDRTPGNLAERDGYPQNLITWDRVPQNLIRWNPSDRNRDAQDPDTRVQDAQDPDTRVRDARGRDTRDRDTRRDAPRGGVPPEHPARHRGTQDLADSHIMNGLQGSSGSGAHRGGRHGEGKKPVD